MNIKKSFSKKISAVGIVIHMMFYIICCIWSL
jgi:hypothetical protein